MTNTNVACYGDIDVERVLYTEDELKARVAELGKQITKDYAFTADQRAANGAPALLLVSVLRGAAVYMSDLARAIDLPLEMDYMAVSSYGTGVKSSGVVRILKDLSSNIEGRHVLIAEDILDSGLTLSYLIKMLESRNAASVEVAAFSVKDIPGKRPAVNPRYVGIHVPDEFVVGYGLDYAEHYRNLPYLGVLKPEVYEN